MSFDVNTLLKAIDNDKNENIMKLSSVEIKREKNDILQKLGVKGDTLVDLHRRLKEYRYVDSLEQLNYGAYVRWINIKDPTDVYITAGGIIYDMKAKNDSILVSCRSMYGKIYKFDFNTCLVFQKLSKQEKVLLIAMDNLSK